MQRSKVMVYVGWAAAVASPTLAIPLISSVLLMARVPVWLIVTFTLGIAVLGAYGLLMAASPMVAGIFGATARSRAVLTPSVLPSGLAAIMGGILFVAQGIVIMAWNVNLDVLPLALLLFAVGAVGLRRRRGWRLNRRAAAPMPWSNVTESNKSMP